MRMNGPWQERLLKADMDAVVRGKWRKIPGVGMLLALLLFTNVAMAAVETEELFRTKFFLESSVALNFLDEKDAPIDLTEFSRQTKVGKRFAIMKRMDSVSNAVTATFKLMPPPSAKELARARNAEARVARPAQNSKLIGKPLPAFKLFDVEGKSVSNEDLLGRPTLINFFFAECLPCILETPMLNEYQGQRKDLRMLAVTFDDKASIEKYVRKHKFAWRSLVDAKSFIDQVGVHAYPSFMLLDEKGVVKAIQVYPDFVLIEERGVIKAIPIQSDDRKAGVGKVAISPDHKRLDDWVRRGLGH